MHDIKYIRENPELFDANLNKRGIDASSKEILLIDNERRKLQTLIQEKQKSRNEISKKNNCELDIMPVNYGEIFPVSGGLPVHKRPLQRQKYRLQELKRWSEFLKIKLNPEPKHFPSRSLLPSKVIISVKILNFENVNDIAYAIMEGLWIKELNIDDPKNLKKILTRFIKTADEVIDFSESKQVEKEMNKYTKEAIDLAVFGAPTYIIDDQIYWGQDRLDFLERYIKRKNK